VVLEQRRELVGRRSTVEIGDRVPDVGLIAQQPVRGELRVRKAARDADAVEPGPEAQKPFGDQLFGEEDSALFDARIRSGRGTWAATVSIVPSPAYLGRDASP